MTTRTSRAHVPRWRGFRHVIFDCDSTLSAVEGIDVLAGASGLRAPVETLTARAMRGGADLGDVYAKRLDLVKPSRDQVAAVVHAYRRNAVPDAADTVTALQQLGHEVYVVSGGLSEPVLEFSDHLGVLPDHVRPSDRYTTASADGGGPNKRPMMPTPASKMGR